jgi:glycosyltransferase 2 family protein
MDGAADRRAAFRWFLGGLLVAAAAVWLCVLYVDRPVALWISHAIRERYRILTPFLDLTIVLSPLAIIYIIVYAMRRTFARRVSPHENAWFVMATTFLVTLEIKNILKIAFGRTWPAHISANDVDLILPGAPSRGYVNDGIYGFFPFTGTKPFTSFPSGSLSAVVTFSTQLWMLYSWARPLAAFMAAMTFLSLLLTNTHFVSDLVAGFYLGTTVAMYALAVTDIRQSIRRLRPPADELWRRLEPARPYLVRGATGAALLGLSLWSARPAFAHDRLQWWPFAAAVACTPLIVGLRAWRWNAILSAYGAAWRPAALARVYGATMFLGLVSPGRIGELSRIFLLRDRGAPVSVGLYSVVLDRVLDAIPTFLVAIVFVSALHLPPGTIGGLVYVWLVPSAIALGAAALLRPRASAALARPLARRLIVSDDDAPLPEGALPRSTIASVLTLSLASQIVSLVQATLFAAAAGVSVSPLTAYAVVSTVTAVVALPLSLGGIGTREATLLYVLGILGVPASTALLFAGVLFANFVATSAMCLVALTLCPLSVRAALPSLARRVPDAVSS